MSAKLFSVGIVSSNSSPSVFRCIDSVLRQDYPTIELIVVDDHSYNFHKDAVDTYIQSQAGKNLVRYAVFSAEEAVGPVGTGRRCLEQMQGSYLKLLSTDEELYDSGVLTAIAKYMESTGSLLVCADEAPSENGSPVSCPSVYHPSDLRGMTAQEQYCFFLTHSQCPIPESGLFFQRTFFDNQIECDDRYSYAAGWPFLVWATRAGYVLDGVDISSIRRFTPVGADTEFTVDDLQLWRNQECMALLRGELPHLRELGGHRQAWLCRYSAATIEMRQELDFYWKDTGFWQKLLFRLKMLPFLFYGKLRSAVRYGTQFSIVWECVGILLLGSLTQMGIRPLPWDASGHWTAALMLLLTSLLVLKGCAKGVVALGSLIARVEARFHRK